MNRWIAQHRFVACISIVLSMCIYALSSSAATPPSLTLSQIPLTAAIPLHPQVLFAVGNSQSMDGNLAGAIMAGSGSLGSSLSSLSGSSSPTNYTIPSGFTPPLNAGSGGSAPYTVNTSGTLYDNSPSRLNVAKAGVQAILQAYMPTTDFALETYSTGSNAVYSTWVYYMSASGGFTFANSLPTTPPTSGEWVANPCYLYSTAASSTVKSNCTSIANAGLSGITATVLNNNAYMYVAASSDDPNISDVLYASSLSGLCIAYGGPSPANPYPPNFSLTSYENGGILESYTNQTSSCATATGPTNAGYVPYSKQVMYAQRGFGFYVSSQSANSASIAVPMTSAGQTPTTTSVQTALNAFSAKLAPETNSTSTSEIKAAAVQSPLAALMVQAKTYLASTSTNTSGCALHQYVVLITDGLPTEDLSGKFWPPLGSAAATGYGLWANFNADGSLTPDLSHTNDQALIDLITKIAALNTAGVKTFVVGLGAGVNPSINPQAANTLTAMAIAGGTNNYFPATSPAALVSDLDTILQQVLTGSASTSAAAVNSTGLNNNSVVYQAAYTVSDSPYSDWTGNLTAFPVNASTGAVNMSAPIWHTQAQLDAQATTSGWPSNRLIATWNPSTAKGVPFEWGNISPAQQAQLQPSDSYGSQRVSYLRGDITQEKRNGGLFRNRSHLLGDIVDSNPQYIGSPNGPFSDASYNAFLSAQSARAGLLYVGANDGMLHAFDPTTGNEKFAFVPNGIFANLSNLTNSLYNGTHHFYVDGSPQAGDVMFPDGTWHTLLAGGEGAGGNTIYGLDVTNPAGFTSESALASAFLWEFSDTDMGASFGNVAFGRVNVSSLAYTGTPAAPGFAVFFGNGYNSSSGHAILYAINPATGALIQKIDLCAKVASACSTSLPNGLSGVVVANSNGYLGQPVNIVYAGDLQGNMWAINVSDANPTNWSVRVLFQARDSLGNPQPITTTPLVTLNPLYPSNQGLMVIFGTGQLLASADLSNTQVQSFYGVWDNGSSTAATRSNLLQQTLTDVSAATAGTSSAVQTDTSLTVNWTSQRGWYFDFADTGQRMVTQPLLDDGAVAMTSNTLTATTCAVNISSYLTYVDYSSGGAFPTPRLQGFSINSANIVSISLGNVFAASPTFISANNGKMGGVIYVNTSTGQIKNINRSDTSSPRMSWWRIQ